MIGLHLIDNVCGLSGIFHRKGLTAQTNENNPPKINSGLPQPQSGFQHFLPVDSLIGGLQQRIHTGLDPQICSSKSGLPQ